MCVSVYLLALSQLHWAALFDRWSTNLVQGLTLMTSLMSLMVKVISQGHPVEKCSFRVLAWVFCALIGISAWKRFMCVHAQNSVHVLANSTHRHARNHEICLWAQTGSARGGAANFTVFLAHLCYCTMGSYASLCVWTRPKIRLEKKSYLGKLYS